MSSRRSARRSGGTTVADEGELQATCSEDEEPVYAGSSSGRGSSCGTSLSSSDGYLHSVDSCCGGPDTGSRHYEEVRDDWASPLRSSSEGRGRLGVGQKAVSGVIIQTQSRWTTSSLFCGISTLLAACSLSSLSVCIALTSFGLTRIEPGLSASGAVKTDYEGNVDIVNGSQIHHETERPLLLPLAEYRASHKKSSVTRSEWAARYSWDCTALAGLAKCRPVQKARSRRDGPLSSHRQHDRHTATPHVLANGIYHMSVQITGKVWPSPPTILRAVIERVQPRFGTSNVTNVHTISGETSRSHSFLRSAFSVYTAAAVYLGADDELLAKVTCLEQPECIVHVNGTTSYLTLQRLD